MAANYGNVFSCDISVEEVTVNTITSSRPTTSTSSASMISTSNVMVNDSNLGTKQANVIISFGSTSLKMKLVKVIQLALFGPVASLRGEARGGNCPHPSQKLFLRFAQIR